MLNDIQLINESNLEGFEKSLDYIHELYQRREDIKANRKEYKRMIKIRDLLKKTKLDIANIFGSIKKDELFKYIELKEPPDFYDGTYEEKIRLEKREKELEELLHKYSYFKLKIYQKLHELISAIPGTEHYEINQFFPWSSETYSDYLDILPKIRKDPLKLIFKIWHKKLRKGMYGDIKKLEFLLLKYKEITKGTEKEYLFKKLDGNTNFNSLRKKSLYGLDELYEKITDFIYEKSFIDRTN